MATGHIDPTILANIDANTQNQTVLDPVKIKAFYDEVAAKNDGNYDFFLADYLASIGLYRQAIINGNFDVWQRGTSFTNPASNAYTADRWKVVYDGTGQQFTVSQQAFTPGQNNVPNEPSSFLRHQVTTAATGQTFNTLQQLIESVRTFSGRKVTVSFWAKADANRNINLLALRQNFGTGGSPSAIGDTPSSSFALTTNWQKFTATLTVPSISGKTLGTNNDHSLGLLLYLPTNTLMTIDIAQLQINAGDQALPFQPRSYDDELRSCLRYFEIADFTAVQPAVATGTANCYSMVRYSKKRAIPTCTPQTTGGVNGQLRWDIVNVSSETLASNAQFASQDCAQVNTAVATAARNGVSGKLIVDAEL